MTIVTTNIRESSKNGVFINRRREYDLRVTVGFGWLTMHEVSVQVGRGAEATWETFRR